uniref:Uncharacterized protein n=1 Tax=viral metagenome TaxID=1070528 RepID=A0A6M3KPH1_9ZZZZ
MATYKVKYLDKNSGKEHEMLFGDSYKSWKMQRAEYEGYFPELKRVEVLKSNSEWKGWGGLKWCEVSSFQKELNREGCQTKDPDNPNPRQFKNFIFKSLKTAQEKKLTEGIG